MKRREPAPVLDSSDRSWHLDRKVPVSIILAIMVQSAGVFWWAASANERLNSLEQKALLFAPQSDRLTRVEVNIDSIKDSLNEIKAIMRKRP